MQGLGIISHAVFSRLVQTLLSSSESITTGDIMRCMPELGPQKVYLDNRRNVSPRCVVWGDTKIYLWQMHRIGKYSMYLKFIVYKNGWLDWSPDQMPEFLHVCMKRGKKPWQFVVFIHIMHFYCSVYHPLTERIRAVWKWNHDLTLPKTNVSLQLYFLFQQVIFIWVSTC